MITVTINNISSTLPCTCTMREKYKMISGCLGLGRGESSGNPLQYSCLENPMGGGAW